VIRQGEAALKSKLETSDEAKGKVDLEEEEEKMLSKTLRSAEDSPHALHTVGGGGGEGDFVIFPFFNINKIETIYF
jgi:hypothetical protein